MMGINTESSAKEGNGVILREDILSMEYLKKTEFTGCHKGMRYRLEGVDGQDGEKKLRCSVWPEPFGFGKTAADKRDTAEFAFEESGVTDAVAWMNSMLAEKKDRWEHARDNWDGGE